MMRPILLTLALLLIGSGMMVLSHHLVQKTSRWRLARWLFWGGLTLFLASVCLWIPPKGGTAWWQMDLNYNYEVTL